MKLQTILLPNENICSEKELYFHIKDDWVIFDGYFNLFYLEKYHEYCDIRKLELRLFVSGIKKIVLMHDREAIREASFENMSIVLELPYDEYSDGVFWFKAEPVDI